MRNWDGKFVSVDAYDSSEVIQSYDIYARNIKTPKISILCKNMQNSIQLTNNCHSLK